MELSDFLISCVDKPLAFSTVSNNMQVILSDSVLDEFRRNETKSHMGTYSAVNLHCDMETGRISSYASVRDTSNDPNIVVTLYVPTSRSRKLYHIYSYAVTSRTCVKHLIATEHKLNSDTSLAFWAEGVLEKVARIKIKYGLKEAWKWNYEYSLIPCIDKTHNFLQLYALPSK